MSLNPEVQAAPSPHSDPNNIQNLSRPVPPTYKDVYSGCFRIDADNQDKRTVCIFWAIFFIVIIVVSIVSAFRHLSLRSPQRNICCQQYFPTERFVY